MNHIELFSGCGGLSLGLAHSGFELTLANELSPMAAESFAYNFFNEDLEMLANLNQMPTQTLWLNSNFAELKPRLRENPFTFPSFDDANIGTSDLPKNIQELHGKLIVGSIVEINRLLESNDVLVKALRSAFGNKRGLDLVSGGPPCQSFSMAGLRNRDCVKNTLPWEFAKFVKFTQPKIALLENVTGILRAFKNKDGEAFHAWYEVAKAFASLNYVPLCLHVNARLTGVPQNRPRFIIIAIRHDHLNDVFRNLNDDSQAIFKQPLDFYRMVQNVGTDLEFGHLDYRDAIKEHTIFNNSFLQPLIAVNNVSVQDALDDLKINNPSKPSDYVNKLNTLFNNLNIQNTIHNHDFRSHNGLVQRRFRIYQILQNINNRNVTNAVFAILKGKEVNLSNEAWKAVNSYSFLRENGDLTVFNRKNELELYLQAHPTKKQTQKALIAHAPAPAALSIPDDACHYDHQELRVLTVREMARIQSFPDNFVFRSKITTGGQMRKFEVPQYTQVGNAVPPLLGFALGQCITSLL